jgi:NADH:ubiquinone oxidoreductase subunit 4 (subunit M)
LTDDELVSRGLLRLSEVTPRSARILLTLSMLGMLAGAGLALWAHFISAALVFFGSCLLFQAAAAITVLRILFMLHRAQLELRILATQLPIQAASLVVKHMTPAGLNPT